MFLLSGLNLDEMNQAPYPYKRELDTKYTFVSEGKKAITKVIQFSLTSERDLYCLGFGDLLEDSTIDDFVISNNGDIIKVIATVFKIAEKFTEEFPNVEIYFTGSTSARTLLYNRIIRTNYRDLIKKFKITGFKRSEEGLIIEDYKEWDKGEYVFFSLKRKSNSICAKERN